MLLFSYFELSYLQSKSEQSIQIDKSEDKRLESSAEANKESITPALSTKNHRAYRALKSLQ